MDARTIGVLGGGQLGRMLAQAAHRLGIRVAVLDPGGSASPAGQLADLCIEGSFRDEAKIRELASISDILTVEIEHVDTFMLEHLEGAGVDVQPPARCIRLMQDKLLQKQYFAARGVPCGEFRQVASRDDCAQAGDEFGFPLMLKSRKLAYDGRGNAVVRTAADIGAAWTQLTRAASGSSGDSELYVEKWVPFVKELAVMAAFDGRHIRVYPVVETVQKDNICHIVTAPAQISAAAEANAQHVARTVLEALRATNGDQQALLGRGVYGIEMFLLPDDSVLLNEVAPRPHNSGHYTIEACDIDQFDMHVRCVLQLPTFPPSMRAPFALMINVLGEEHETGLHQHTLTRLRAALSVPGAAVHWYGKEETRRGRKMAHITITANDLHTLAHRAGKLGITAPFTAQPKVAVIMGSDSDLPTMSQACEVLDRFRVPYLCTIVSAHRTPSRMYTFAQTAAERGFKVIIAGAGGAAHLPGMVAALTPLPVIGVPIKTSTLNGEDSLLSIVQMPKGVPVATVAIGNAANAALLAVRMLGMTDLEKRRAMAAYMEDQEECVLIKASRLEELGHEAYLAESAK